MAWVYLFFAGLLECGWVIGLKYTQGFTKLQPSVLTVLAMIASFWLLAEAMKDIPAGIGAVGVAIIGMTILGEQKDLARVACLLLIVAGIVGLKLVGTTANH